MSEVAFPAGVRRARALLTLAAIPPLLCAAAVSARAYVDGPPPAHTGGFGEATCHACHADYPLNGGGALAIEGAPATYEPGRSYELRVVLRHPELRTAGFQLAARFAAGPGEGTQAGTLRVGGEDAIVASIGGIAYAQHTKAGTAVTGPGERIWQVTWTAPAQPSADIVLHLAANAANDDLSEFGDRIITSSLTISARTK
jgi:hypothetical protein